MLAEEIFYRAGGLVNVNPILETSLMLHEGAAKSTEVERLEGYGEMLFNHHSIKSNDILFLFSNSGRNGVAIDMGIIARERGIKTVVITNENVTFGNGSSGMIFTNKTNGDGSAITIYVPTEEVKARLLAADTAAKDYGGYKIVVGDPVVENDTEIDEAINDGITTLILGSGNYILPDSAQGKTLTIIGNGDTVVAVQDDGSYEGCDYSLRGATVTFENVTINTDSSTYTGYAGLKATYNNCTINGTYTLYDDSTFNNCTFNVSGDVYNIWTWGATNATFNNCTFNSDGKAVLLYGASNTNLTINNCTFNDKGGLTDKKAAIEIGDDYKKNFTLTVTNTVVNGYEINDKGTNTGTTLWGNKNSMSADRLTVIVDGVKVYGN
jgi:hypothetical protein